MNITLKNKSLLDILTSVKGIVPARPTHLYQHMVLVSPAKEGCYFYTQGPDAQIRYYSKELSIDKPVKALISVSKIFEISRNFPEKSDISLLFNDNSFVISCEGSDYQLKSIPADEFPLMKEPDKKDTVELAERDLKYLLEKTEFCIASHDPRPYLNGLLLSLEDNKLFTVATDSHRLAMSSIAVSNKGKISGILPRDIVAEVKRLSSETKDIAEVSMSSEQITFSLKNIQISSKEIKGAFPDYKKVIPKDFLIEIVLVRQEFLRSLQRASAISMSSSVSDEGVHVNLTFSKNELLIKSSNLDGEEANVKQDIEYSEDDFEISFNSRYLQDVMKTLDTEKIRLQMRDASSGTRIIGEGSTSEEYIVMPLRL